MNLEKLKTKFSGDISQEEQDLVKHSRDASIFALKPEVIVYPKTVADVQEIARWMSEEKKQNPYIYLAARAAGTCMSGGSLTDSVSVDFTRYFNRILNLQDNNVTCEPGLYYRDLEKVLKEKGLIYPSYPASKDLCAIGGIVSNNSGGEKSLTYGQTWQHVRSLEVVLADGSIITTRPLNRLELAEKCRQENFEGEIYRRLFTLLENNYELIQNAKPKVSKNSAGYLLWHVWDKNTFDLTKLFVGAQGTLGLITKATLDLVRPKPCKKLLVIFLSDMTVLGNLVTRVLEFKPETFESFDDHTFKLAIKFFPQLLRRMKGGLFKLGFLFMPEVILTLTGGVPKLLLIAEFTGDTPQETDLKAQKCKAAIEHEFNLKTHITQTDLEAQKYWIMRRESFSLLREKIKDKHTAPFIDDVTVPVKTLPDFLPKLNTILSGYPHLIYTIAGHAGDANFHIIPLMNLADKADRDIIVPLSHAVYDLVLSFKGSITAEHNDGIIRGPFLEQMYGKEVFSLFKEVKTICDPSGIFNPYKKTGADFNYLNSHIVSY